ncbi:MAG: class I SAM-dependent methyltransferase [Acidimicrobiales bacterium]
MAKGLGASRYLEIGLARGQTFENIDVGIRVGVDPAPRFDIARLPVGVSVFAVESDTYFASLAPWMTFDLAFIDGLHTFEQTKADLLNAFRHVPDGALLIDDTVPSDEIAAMRYRSEADAQRRKMASDDKRWMGDVWKLVVYINGHLPQLDFRTIVGSGNIQTLVWRHQPGTQVSEPLRDSEDVAGLNYREFFRDGIPEMFRPCSEPEAIGACLSHLKGQITPPQDPARSMRL